MDWKSRAEKALASGYVRGNPWEQMLRRHLHRNYHQLVVEFQNARCFGSYLIVRTNEALNRVDELESQGTSPESARELALNELLQKPAEAPAAWEIEGAQQDIMAAVSKHLGSLSASRPKPTTPPT